MLDEILSSAKTTLVERLASPLLGSFVVAWCAWNYRFLIVLLSEKSITKTFELIDTVIFPTPLAVVTHGFLFPLISALVYVFIYPYPARFVYGFTRRRQKEINQLRQQIEDETPMTKEESRALRLEYLERERSWKEKMDSLVGENESLKSAVRAPTEISVKQTPVIEQNENVKDLEEGKTAIRLAERIASSAELMESFDLAIQRIQNGYPLNGQVPEKELAFFEANGIVSSSTGGGTYKWTELGKKVLKEYLDSRY